MFGSRDTDLTACDFCYTLILYIKPGKNNKCPCTVLGKYHARTRAEKLIEREWKEAQDE